MKEKVLSICNELSTTVGDTFDIPVLINPRLTRTLGRVCSYTEQGVRKVRKMEISKTLMETGTDQSIKDVVAHEWAHYYITKTTGVGHGHDSEFKRVCAMVGCTNDKTSTTVERKPDCGPVSKYTIVCPVCGPIGGRTRWSSTLDRIDTCTCVKCKSSNLSIIQNW